MYDHRLKTKLIKFKAFYSFKSVFLSNKKTVEFGKAEHILMWHNKTFTNKGKVYLQHVKELISLMMKMMMIKCLLLLMYDKCQQYK